MTLCIVALSALRCLHARGKPALEQAGTRRRLVVETLDVALAARLEAILSQPATEAELRRTSEEGDAALRVLRGRLRRSEELLARSSGEAEGTLGEFASELRRKHELEREFRQLSDLLARLDLRARELRMSWLAGSSARPAGISSRP